MTKLSVILILLCFACSTPPTSTSSGQNSDGDLDNVDTTPTPGETSAAGRGHWAHIDLLDFGRGVKYIANAADRQTAQKWFAEHIDVAEGQTEMRVYNPKLKLFNYELDLTRQQFLGDAGIPESAFFHVSEDTTITYRTLPHQVNGTYVADVIKTITIPGCPSPMPLAKSCRFLNYIWTDERWAFNLGDAQFQTWQGDRLMASMMPDLDGLFLDEHGPDPHAVLSLATDGTKPWGQTLIVSGGGIREFGGAKIYDDTAATQWNTAAKEWLQVLQARAGAVGKFLLPNVATWFNSYPSTIDQAMAAKGATLEGVHYADGGFVSAAFYAGFIQYVKNLVDAGGTVDLYGSPCHFGPTGYTPGNSTSANARYNMWALGSYYMVRGGPSAPGVAYLNTSFCIKFSEPANALNFMNEWIKAYEVDVGQPAGEAAKVASGTAGGCSYDIYKRSYTKGLVYVRPKSCSDYGDSTATTVTVDSPMRMLRDDGMLLPPATTFQLRNTESLILLNP